jgi:hypothetical protein
MADKQTCPKSCPLKDNGCYAAGGFIRLHWDKLSKGKGGLDFKNLSEAILELPRGQYLRYADAGDLPGDGTRIDLQKVLELSESIQKAEVKGFTYTHYLSNQGIEWDSNYHTIRAVLSHPKGLTINISTENLRMADSYRGLGLPAVCTIQQPKVKDPLLYWKDNKVFVTPGNNRAIVCPAVYSDTQCIRCGGKIGPLCWQKNRDFIILFPAHGSGTKQVNEIVERI